MTSLNYEKLNRHNYRCWKIDVICHLEQEGVSKWIEKDTQPVLPETCTFSERLKWEQLKERAVGIIKGSCDLETRQIIETVKDPSEAWNALTSAFEASSRAWKAHLLTEYMNVKLLPDEPMSVFIARFEAAYRRVTETGEAIEETHRCFQLIRYLPDDYDGLVRELYNSSDSEFKFDKIKDKLLGEYGRRVIKEGEKGSSPDSFVVASSSKVNANKRFSKGKARVRCHSCGNVGHLAKQCRKRMTTYNKPPQLSKTTFKESSVSFLANCEDCYEVNYKEKEQLSCDWIVDSATSAHICSNKEFFQCMWKAPAEAVVKMGLTPHKVESIGQVKFKITVGNRWEIITLNKVLYVPSIDKNLISVSKMEDAGLHAKLENGLKIYTSDWNYLFTAKRINNFYILRGIPERKENLDSSENVSLFAESNVMKWHQRYGHCSVKTLKEMVAKSLVNGIGRLTGQEEICEPCQLAKSTRASHPRLSEIRSKDLLQLIHADVWGPAPVQSFKGYRYILTFIDDFSRRSFCFPLKSKDQVVSKFKEFIPMVERQVSKKIRTIRTDNGLEFCNNQVRNLLKNTGIKHECTTTYSPQMNGIAERFNRTLLEGVRTHLESTRLPIFHWIEAVMATNYIKNRTLHTATGNTPFYRWYNKRPNVKHFRRLGCVAYVHQDKVKRNKFQPRAKKGVFIGYGLGTSGYRVWYPQENTIVESKHVKFDENKFGNEVSKSNDVQRRIDRMSDWIIEWEEEPPQAEVQIPGTSGSCQTEQPFEVTFTRTWSERKSGTSVGRLDIYYKTTDGKMLRSKNEVRNYCSEKKLEYDPNQFNFSTKDKAMHKVTLKRKSKEIDNQELSEDDLKDQNEDLAGDSVQDELTENECSCGELLGEVYCTDVVVPKTVAQASNYPEAKQWKKAMDIEMEAMEARKVWTLVQKPPNAKVIGSRWVFTLKRNAHGHIASYKARLVALGNRQLEGRDYEETYSPVVNFTLIRFFILLFIVILGWKHSILDVKNAYLYGTLDKELYMQQPSGYIAKGKESYVLKIEKSLYGLHQAGRCWYQELHTKLLEVGFEEIPGMICVYNYHKKAIVQVYVDDIPIYAKNESVLEEVINLIKSIYEVKNLGPINQLLGVNFNCNDKYAFINQSNYITQCLKKFNCDIFCKTFIPMSPGMIPSKSECPKSNEERQSMLNIPYRNLLGCLMFLASRSRPDITFSIASLSQFCENPAKSHWKKLKNVLYYLASTRELGLEYINQGLPLQLTTYVDASWASDPSDRRSWSGYCIFLSGRPLTWRVTKQTCVAQSPMEAEFIAVSEAVKELKYTQNVLSQLHMLFNFEIERPVLYCDSTAAIQFTRNRIENIKNRYIDLRYMFVRDLYLQGLFTIKHVPTKENIADMFTKALGRSQFEYLRNFILC